MKTFYTNVQQYGSKILFRGVENGRKVRERVDYFPTLFIPAKKPTEYTTVTGQYVSPIKPGDIRECRDFLQRHADIDNFKVFGNQKYDYTFISDNYPGEIDWDRKLIKICNIDIEVGSENGFPHPETANEPITAITFKTDNKFIVFGCGEFVNIRKDVQYRKCRDEIDLIKQFIDEWSGSHPDIVTGWYIKFFDIPYLVNRITKLFGDKYVKALSPWNLVRETTINIMGKDNQVFFPVGVSILDYQDLYKKFAPEGKSKERYNLDFICHEELGERKISYDEYENLHRLYKENYQLFIEYNIRDVELVDKLDNKLKLLDLALTLAYDSKTNYEDVFSQVRMWDSLIYNELKKQKKVVPPITSREKDESYIGAYVKVPQVGMHHWIASFDLNSLYPHLIMQYNISPDKLIEADDYTPEMAQFLSTQDVGIDNLLKQKIDTQDLQTWNVTLTPNGQFFKVDGQGFLAKMMEEMYNGRSLYKKKALQAEKDLQSEQDPARKVELENMISRYNNLQLAKKVSLNSAYGALGNEYFRFFDTRQATAITTAGQLSIRWIENKLNQYLNRVLQTNDKDYVIASDTDSIYLSLDELVRKTIKAQNPTADTKTIIRFLDKVCQNKIQPHIDKCYNELARYLNVMSQKMFMKRENLADRGVWTAKKRYILNVHNKEGIEYSKPKIKVMGLEMIKSSTPSAVRKKLWESIDILINKTEDEMIEFIESFKKEFKTLPVEDISFPRGVNGLDKYSNADKGIPIHVKGSYLYNNLLKKFDLEKKYQKINQGEKIKYIYLKQPNVYHTKVISFPQSIPSEMKLDGMIDYNTQFQKSFLEPLKAILDCVGWKHERTLTLEAFFS